MLQLFNRRKQSPDFENTDVFFTPEDVAELFPYPDILTDQDYFLTTIPREGSALLVPEARYPSCRWWPGRHEFFIKPTDRVAIRSQWPDILLQMAIGSLIAGVAIAFWPKPAGGTEPEWASAPLDTVYEAEAKQPSKGEI